jgi:hypothetical protein
MYSTYFSGKVRKAKPFKPTIIPQHLIVNAVFDICKAGIATASMEY